jgi:hypothetical protein
LGAFIGVSTVKDDTRALTVEDDGAYDWQRGRDKMRELKQNLSE